MRWVRSAAVLLAAGLAAATGGPPVAAQQGGAPSPDRVVPAAFGEPFPGGNFRNLNQQAGGPPAIALDQVLGQKPVILVYWIPRNRRAEEILLEVQALIDDIDASEVALYGVTTVGGAMTAEAVQARSKEIGIRVPVLEDEGFRIGQQLRVQLVPNITILDREGRLRLTNGASLTQTLEYKMDLADAIRRVATTGRLGTYGMVPKYYPAVELVGKKSPDFNAPAVSDGIVYRWSNLIDPRKLNVLIFWSIDCPHCRKSLPEINDWLRQNPDGINVVTAAKITSDAMKTKTKEFTTLHSFEFPTLIDAEREIFDRYYVISTPSVFIVGPDGVVDSVLLSGTEGLAEKLEAKKKELLPAAAGS